MRLELVEEQDQEEIPERKGNESLANMHLGGGPGVSKPSRCSVSLAIFARAGGGAAVILPPDMPVIQRAKLSFKEVAVRNNWQERGKTVSRSSK